MHASSKNHRSPVLIQLLTFTKFGVAIKVEVKNNPSYNFLQFLSKKACLGDEDIGMSHGNSVARYWSAFCDATEKPKCGMCVSNSHSAVCTSQKLTLETRFAVHTKMLWENSVVCSRVCGSVCECNDAARIVRWSGWRYNVTSRTTRDRFLCNK